MFQRNKKSASPEKGARPVSRWVYIVAIALTVVLGQFAIARAFKQQQSKVLVQSSHAMLSVKGFSNQAEREALKAVNLNKFEGYAWFNYGTSLYLQKEFPAATEVLTKGMEYLPHSYNALRLVAFSNYRLGNFADASAQFQEYLSMIPMPPVSPEIVFRLAGLSCLRGGDLAESNYFLMYSTRLSSEKGDLLRIRSMISLLNNQLWSADYCYRAFRFHLPDEEFNPFETVANALRDNKILVAVEYLESIYSRNPSDLSVVKALAAAYTSSKQVKKAEELISAAVNKFPEDGGLRLVYGDILFSQKRYPESMEQYDEHLRLMPESQFRQDILKKKATTR